MIAGSEGRCQNGPVPCGQQTCSSMGKYHSMGRSINEAHHGGGQLQASVGGDKIQCHCQRVPASLDPRSRCHCRRWCRIRSRRNHQHPLEGQAKECSPWNAERCSPWNGDCRWCRNRSRRNLQHYLEGRSRPHHLEGHQHYLEGRNRPHHLEGQAKQCSPWNSTPAQHHLGKRDRQRHLEERKLQHYLEGRNH